MDKYIKPAVLLTVIMIVTAVAVRWMSRGETLLEYGERTGQTIDPAAAEVSSDASEGDEVSPDDKHPSSDASDGDEVSSENKPVTGDDRSEAADEGTLQADAADEASSETTEGEIEDNISEAAENSFTAEPIPDEVYQRMLNVSYPEDCEVSLDELSYLRVLYRGFDGDTKEGELVCSSSIAADLIDIFRQLYEADYRIESIKLIDDFDGDDTASMEANNTSCFNYRLVEGTDRLSNHARGLAVDLNPFYNPYVTFPGGVKRISPEGSEMYADRTLDFPYKIDTDDLAYRLFTQHGFRWGGNWNSMKDYQHFEKAD